MSKISSKAFIDSSFFKAIIDKKDDFNEKANKILKRLEKENASLITSNYILDESFTLIRTRCGLKMVDEFRKNLASSSQTLKIIRVTIADEAKAWEWFLNDWSKLSFTDCVSFALMKRLNLTRVATFDEHFKKAGFKIEN
ncbi:MAG: PIN domain-containing protein [Candidatus Levybacteria bacterium]|nr:PIN domain-containing protein [Candidatus Levybacteria bacterium]